MGRDKHERGQRERLPPFVPLFIITLDSPAWRALSHGARSLYVALKRRVGTNNNGAVYSSASATLRSNRLAPQRDCPLVP